MPARVGVEELDRDLRAFRDLVGSSNAVYARATAELGRLLAGPSADDAVLDRLESAWSERSFRAFYERPLLLLASIRADALATGPAHPLARSFAAQHPDPDEVTRDALALALRPERVAWKHLRSRHVQTNDVSRAIAWRLPARAISRDGSRSLVLLDVGCAAGLNLVADRISIGWRDPAGARIDLEPAPKVIERRGFDRDPIDVRHADEAAWLRACTWPGDHARLDRLEDAIDVMVATWHRREPVRVEAVRARDVPRRVASIADAAPAGAFVLAYQSFVAEYLEDEEAAAYRGGMERWLASLAPGRGAWVELELVDRTGPMPAALVVHAKAGTELRTITLARCSYHPSIVDVSQEAMKELEALFAPGPGQS